MKVWKFQLEVTDEQVVRMPRGAELLFVGAQDPTGRSIQLWAKVDPNASEVDRRIIIEGTGHDLVRGATYVGSVITAGGALVWHVFDGGERP